MGILIKKEQPQQTEWALEILQQINALKTKSPGQIHEYFSALFKDMDVNAREAVFKTLYGSFAPHELRLVPFELRQGMRAEVMDDVFTTRQFSVFSDIPSSSTGNAPAQSRVSGVTVVDVGVGMGVGTGEREGRQGMEDQIMSILVQVLHRAERTNAEDAFLRRGNGSGALD